jgi:hypothetical protein
MIRSPCYSTLDVGVAGVLIYDVIPYDGHAERN